MRAVARGSVQLVLTGGLRNQRARRDLPAVAGIEATGEAGRAKRDIERDYLAP